MENFDFTELESKAEAIFTDVAGIDLRQIEKRILREIEQIEAHPV